MVRGRFLQFSYHDGNILSLLRMPSLKMYFVQNIVKKNMYAKYLLNIFNKFSYCD